MRDEEVRADMRSNVATNRGFACERSLAVLGPPPDRCATLPTLPSTLYPLPLIQAGFLVMHLLGSASTPAPPPPPASPRQLSLHGRAL